MGRLMLRAQAQSGQGLVEYAIVMVVVLITLGAQVKNMFSNISTALGT
jgi:Flp pilus assembly pilin Flp